MTSNYTPPTPCEILNLGWGGEQATCAWSITWQICDDVTWQAAASGPAVILICTRTDWLWIFRREQSRMTSSSVDHLTAEALCLWETHISPVLASKEETDALFKEIFTVQVGQDATKLPEPKSQKYLNWLWHHSDSRTLFISRPVSPEFYQTHPLTPSSQRPSPPPTGDGGETF